MTTKTKTLTLTVRYTGDVAAMFGQPKPVVVTDLADASRAYGLLRDTSGAGASEISEGIVREGKKKIARVSYNGRVWPPGPWKAGEVALWPLGEWPPQSKKIQVRFDDSPTWDAEDMGRWNGFVVPRVTAEVREEIAAWIQKGDRGEYDGPRTYDEVRALPVDGNGKVVIDLGLCFGLVTEEGAAA